MFHRNHVNLAAVVILTLLLTAALASVASAEAPGGVPGVPPTATATASVGPPSGGGGGGPGGGGPPGGGGGGPGGGGPPGGGTPAPPPTPGSGGGGGASTAPAWPPPELIVTHAATPFQLTPVGAGLVGYFIGPDGTGYSGPYIDSFSNLAASHSVGVVQLYSGTNPGSGKPVTISYLASEKKIHISTFYPDTEYDTNKKYVFTVDAGHTVTHIHW